MQYPLQALHGSQPDLAKTLRRALEGFVEDESRQDGLGSQHEMLSVVLGLELAYVGCFYNVVACHGSDLESCMNTNCKLAAFDD